MSSYRRFSTQSSRKYHPMNMVTCLNCGKDGHKSSKCNDAIKSYGIIAFKRKRMKGDNHLIPLDIKEYIHDVVYGGPPGLGHLSCDDEDGLFFLLVQRRDSIAYVDIMRGNYRNNTSRILDTYFQEMIPSEKLRLKTKTFKENSDTLWVNKYSTKKQPSHFKSDHEIAEKKFNAIDIDTLLDNNKSKYWHTSFGFPKGRKRNIYESDIDCAVREFCEESGYNHESIHVDENFFVTEKFIGSDGIVYEQKYWIAECMSDDVPHMDPTNNEQVGEIGSVGWFNVSEADKLFYDDHHEKRRVLIDTNNELMRRSYLNVTEVRNRPGPKIES